MNELKNPYLILLIIFFFGVCLTSFGQNTYQKVFGGNEDDAANCVCSASDSLYLISGYTESFGSGGKDILIIKMDQCGDIVWQKAYGGIHDDEATHIMATIDNGYLLTGVTKSFGQGGNDIFVIKIDQEGNILWANAFGGTLNDRGRKILETNNGYYITGDTKSFGQGLSDIYLIKIDLSGNFLWSKVYGGGDNDGGHSILQSLDGNIIISGSSYSYGNAHQIMIMKTDPLGNLIWFKTYGGSGTDGASDIIQLNDGSLITTGNASGGAGNLDFFLLKTDNDGNLDWYKTYGGSSEDWGYSVLSTIDNGFIISGYTDSFGFGDRDIYVVKTNSSGSLEWSQTYGGPDFDGGQIHEAHQTISISNAGDYLISDYTTSAGAGGGDVYIIKTDTQGFIENCSYNIPNTIINSPSIYIEEHVPIIIQENTVQNADFLSSEISLIDSTLCGISINLGSDTIICEGNYLELSVEEGFISYLWNNESTQTTIIVDTSGYYWVEVTNEYGCSTVDSIQIEFIPSPQINLGNDTLLCVGDNLELSAEAGFLSYLWNNGSIDSIFVADTAGVYWVYVENPCGFDSDTIVLEILPETVIDLGNDTAVCHNESILLDPGFGFESYIWQDGSSNQLLYAAQTGSYWVQVMDNNSCYAFDTINLEFILPDLEIGSDTAICSGDSITFFASDGFISYLWQNGSEQISLTTGEQGPIWCEVMDTIGCLGTDSLMLDILFPPIISLGNDTAFCVGDSLWLSVSQLSNSNDIIWQDGSDDSTMLVWEESEYWVMASNACGSYSDTVLVSVSALPWVYIGNDTILAMNTQIELDAGVGFEEYFWCDGCQTQSITISEGGSYWVNVFDGQCYNTDTIYIEPIECELFIPIVFTPNWDGSNDYFYAEASKDIIDFDLIVFNRWGEKIWETQDKDGKWDGQRGEAKADDGTYYWILKYSCVASTIQIEKKGSVTLLR